MYQVRGARSIDRTLKTLRPQYDRGARNYLGSLRSGSVDASCGASLRTGLGQAPLVVVPDDGAQFLGIVIFSSTRGRGPTKPGQLHQLALPLKGHAVASGDAFLIA